MSVDFDVIVVGGGIAGLATSYILANKGRDVLLIERGAEPGAKNLSGGVFYSRVMDDIYGDFTTSAPIERTITRNVLTFLNAESAVSIDYWDQRLAEPVNAVSVLRAKLDPWLAERAEDAGVTVMPGVRVDELVFEDGRCVGVRAGDDVLRSHVTVAADGINSFLAQYAGVKGKEQPKNLGLGVKSVIGLGEDVIRERFNLTGDEGTAYAIVGEATKGVPGGAFLYTNRDSVSIGVVVNLEDLKNSDHDPVKIHDALMAHPFIAPLIDGGELLEYGTHMVAEGGAHMQHDLVHPGLLIIGDAAGFTINNGFTIRGMDLAAGSAQAAAEAIERALEAEDYSAEALGAFREIYQSSWLGKDMETFKRAPNFLASTPEMYGDLGQLLADVFHGVYNVDLTPRKKLAATAKDALKASGMSVRRLSKIALNAVRSL